MNVGAGLLHLARQRMWRRWTLASLLARLPLTMMIIALIYAGEARTGSMAVGAQLTGVATASTGIAALWRGRQLDRIELRGGLQRAAIITGAVLVTQALLVASEGPLALMFLLAGTQGVAQAALSGGYRALLPTTVSAADLPRANALEAVFVEVGFVAGPALAGLFIWWVGPVGALSVMAGCAFVSALVTRGLPASHPPAERLPFAWWKAPGAVPVYLLALTLGVCVGLIEAVLPARVDEFGFGSEVAGTMLMLVAFGSAFGGIIASGKTEIRDFRRPAQWLLLAMGVLLVPTSFVGTVALLGGVLLAFGVPIAPLNALGMLRLQSAVPSGRQAEGFSVYLAAILIGAGIGQSITGQLLDNVGANTLLFAAALLPMAAALVLALVPVVARVKTARAHAGGS